MLDATKSNYIENVSPFRIRYSSLATRISQVEAPLALRPQQMQTMDSPKPNSFQSKSHPKTTSLIRSYPNKSIPIESKEIEINPAE